MSHVVLKMSKNIQKCSKISKYLKSDPLCALNWSQGVPTTCHALCRLFIWFCGYFSKLSENLFVNFDRKNTPPPGGFSIYYVPWSRAVCKRFHDEMRRSHLVVKSLTHGSWSGNIVDRKPPPGGGNSFDQLVPYATCSRLLDPSVYCQRKLENTCFTHTIATWQVTHHPPTI